MSGLNDNTWDSEDAGLIAVNKGNETTGALDIELISGESDRELYVPRFWQRQHRLISECL